MARNTLAPETVAAQAGDAGDEATGAIVPPVHVATTFVRDPDNQYRRGFSYGRPDNATVRQVERVLVRLEGGEGALVVASGMTAATTAFLALERPAHVVAPNVMYWGLRDWISRDAPSFGIEATFVDGADPAAIAAAIRPGRTKLVWIETPANPLWTITDIAAAAKIAHAAGALLGVDSTVSTPVLSQPLAHGADLVMHSATKFLGGHGIAIGGILIDSGRFDWAASGKFPTMTEPYAGYHGISFAEEFGPAAFIMRARAEGLRDFGACMSPANAFYLIQGIETLPVRMSRHVANAVAVAQFLQKNAAVAWVKYPGLESHPDYALAKRQLPSGAGAILSFGIKGGRKAGAKLIERLRVFSHLANVGDAKSLVIHPASTTHQQMSAEDLAKAGVGEELVRLSVGLEDSQDLIEDLAQALAASQKG
jgi:O-acetylhomoserine (thiol)-lyase